MTISDSKIIPRVNFQIHPHIVMMLRILQRYGFKKHKIFNPFFGQETWVIENYVGWFFRNNHNYLQLPVGSNNDLISLLNKPSQIDLVDMLVTDHQVTLYRSDLQILACFVVFVNSNPWILNANFR